MRLIAIGHRHPDGTLHARLADGSERVVPPESRVAYTWPNRTAVPPTYGADKPCDCPHCNWSRRQATPTGH